MRRVVCLSRGRSSSPPTSVQAGGVHADDGLVATPRGVPRFSVLIMGSTVTSFRKNGAARTWSRTVNSCVPAVTDGPSADILGGGGPIQAPSVGSIDARSNRRYRSDSSTGNNWDFRLGKIRCGRTPGPQWSPHRSSGSPDSHRPTRKPEAPTKGAVVGRRAPARGPPFQTARPSGPTSGDRALRPAWPLPQTPLRVHFAAIRGSEGLLDAGSRT